MSRTNDPVSSLLFIPDISGFTAFINEVEVEHSTHIISELLEIIIDSNIMRLKVSEIEGDAVLFYRPGKKPELEELLRQVENMFLKFHNHLKYYNTNRICHCNACSTAHDLSLKFVAHFGTVIVKDIRHHEKLLGPDVTLAHRLLKNNIEENDYLLFTPSLNDENAAGSSSTIETKIKKDNMLLPGIGDTQFNYISLSPLMSRINETKNLDPDLLLPGKAVSMSKRINAPLPLVYKVITDANLKPEWIAGLKSVKKETNKLDTIGSRHLCIFPNREINLEITNQETKSGSFTYSERMVDKTWFSPVVITFDLNKTTETETLLIFKINYNQSHYITKILRLPLQAIVKVLAKRSLRNLKKLIQSKNLKNEF